MSCRYCPEGVLPRLPKRRWAAPFLKYRCRMAKSPSAAIPFLSSILDPTLSFFIIHPEFDFILFSTFHSFTLPRFCFSILLLLYAFTFPLFCSFPSPLFCPFSSPLFSFSILLFFSFSTLLFFSFSTLLFFCFFILLLFQPFTPSSRSTNFLACARSSSFGWNRPSSKFRSICLRQASCLGSSMVIS